MKRALWHHYLSTTKHKAQIMWYTLQTCRALLWRALIHDLSKYSREEAEAFAALEDDFADVEFGSARYYERLEILRGALEHHYRVNRHHPEHFPGGVGDMGILDVVEMLIDWRAASLRNRGGNITDSVLKSQQRFGFDDPTATKYTEFFEEVLWP